MVRNQLPAQVVKDFTLRHSAFRVSVSSFAEDSFNVTSLNIERVSMAYLKIRMDKIIA